MSWPKRSLKMASSDYSEVMLLGSLQQYLLAQRILLALILLLKIFLFFRCRMFLMLVFCCMQGGQYWGNCSGHWSSNCYVWWSWYQCSNRSDDCMVWFSCSNVKILLFLGHQNMLKGLMHWFDYLKFRCTRPLDYYSFGTLNLSVYQHAAH